MACLWTYLFCKLQLNEFEVAYSQPRACSLNCVCMQRAGDRFAPRRSTYGRPTGGTDSFNRGQFAAAGGGRGFPQEAGSYPGDRSTFEEGDNEDPVAGGGYSSRDAGGSSSGSSSGSCLSVFVEVHFRGRRQRTSAVDSNAPIWNEQVGSGMRRLCCWQAWEGEDE
jgi:hypothetical protein